MPVPPSLGRTLPRRRFLGLSAAGVAAMAVGCGGGSSPPAPSATASGTAPSGTARPSSSPTATAGSATPTLTPTATPTPTPTATPTSPSPAPRHQPLGFPIDPATRLGIVRGEVGARTIAWGEGPAALAYSRDDQPSSAPVVANRCGWNARVHLEYEGQPAVDWYIAPGTPVFATMDGTAELRVNTVTNPFDHYAVRREPYIGNPDRANAPIVPFPGPGGGQGVWVRVTNDAFVTEYAHLDLSTTAVLLPRDAFTSGYAPGPDLVEAFRVLRDFRTFTTIAAWSVRAGDVVGMSGDSGYSEAPHLHYTVRRAGASGLLCPTAEPGFDDSGWLFRS